MRLTKLFKNKNSITHFVDKSYEILDQAIWFQFTSNPEFPYLVSFPRTGSHWLRNVMELYFKKPSLMRVFYYRNPKDFTCFHIHDQDLTFNESRRVVYLYREPIATIYSQMNYYQEDLSDTARIIYWANLYGMHLNKWLIDYDNSKKIILNYDMLLSNFINEFNKLVIFFGEQLDKKRLKSIVSKLSKQKIKDKVKDDQKVVSSDRNYGSNKLLFEEKYGKLIMNEIFLVNDKLKYYFEP